LSTYNFDVEYKQDNRHGDEGEDDNEGDVARLVAGLASAQDSIAHWTDVSELPEAREATHQEAVDPGAK